MPTTTNNKESKPRPPDLPKEEVNILCIPTFQFCMIMAILHSLKMVAVYLTEVGFVSDSTMIHNCEFVFDLGWNICAIGAAVSFAASLYDYVNHVFLLLRTSKDLTFLVSKVLDLNAELVKQVAEQQAENEKLVKLLDKQMKLMDKQTKQCEENNAHLDVVLAILQKEVIEKNI